MSDLKKLTRKLTVTEAAEILSSGGIVAIPTETVYGLAANALNEEAVKKIFALKGRPSQNPIICHLADTEHVFQYAEKSDIAVKLAKYWPGPVTLLLPHKGRIPSLITAGSDLAGFRIPDHTFTLELLKICDFPVAAPSANLSNTRSPTDVSMVLRHFAGKIDGYLDGGNCRIGIESTVIRINSDDTLSILRPGGLTEERLIKDGFIIKNNIKDEISETHLHSPGQLKKHYTPEIPLALLLESEPSDMINQILIKEYDIGSERDKGTDSIIYLSYNSGDLTRNKFNHCIFLSQTSDLTEIAEKLFRTFDHPTDTQADFLVIKKFPNLELGVALNDRIVRAAEYFCLIKEKKILIYKIVTL
jgi:L-threonylcarbamoyladenylate synthase